MTPGVFTNHDPGVPRPIEIFSQWGERAAMGPCGSLWKSRRDFQGPVDGRTRGVGCPRCAPAVHRTGSFHRVARSPSHRCRLLVVVVFVARPRWPREGQLSQVCPLVARVRPVRMPQERRTPPAEGCTTPPPRAATHAGSVEFGVRGWPSTGPALAIGWLGVPLTVVVSYRVVGVFARFRAVACVPRRAAAPGACRFL